MSHTRPTIKDVAREAGVSHATVSYVLTGSGHAERISAETKRRIFEAAERLGYRSNPVGRALKRGYTDTVVLLIVTWHVAKSHAETAMAISRSALARGFDVAVNVVDSDEEAHSFLKKNMLLNNAGLLVLWDSPAMHDSSIVTLAQEGLPVVDLLPGSPDGISTVTADREHAGYSVTRHLIELGHQKIGFIGDVNSRVKTTTQKYRGYQRALSEAGIALDSHLIQSVTEFGFDGGTKGFREILERRPDVTAVVCINDPMALGVIACAESMGRKCPGDISVAGYGAFDEGSYWRPSLTTVGLSAESVAEKALDEVLRMRTHCTCPTSTFIPGDLIVRESTGPPR